MLSKARQDGPLTKEQVAGLLSESQAESNVLTAQIAHCKTQILDRLPQVGVELSSVSLMANNLRRRLDMLNGQLKSVDERTDRSVALLAKVDREKGRMEHCSRLLAEVQNWRYRLKSIDVLFESREFERIASEIEQMQSCLAMLEKLPGFDRRLSELGELRTRLETMCSPHLLLAMQALDLTALQSFTRIFAKIGRGQAILQMYSSSRTDWIAEAADRIQNESPGAALPQWIATFFSAVLAMVRSELDTLLVRFPDTAPMTLIVDIGRTVRRSLEQWVESYCISDRLTVQGLVAVVDATKDFVVGLVEVEPGALPDDALATLLKSFASVLIPFSTKYSSLEQGHLDSVQADVLSEVNVDRGCEAMLAAVEDSLGPLLDASHQALDRCITFAWGSYFRSFASALDALLTDFSQHFINSLRQIRRLGGFDLSESSDPAWASSASAFRLLRFSSRLRSEVNELELTMITTVGRAISPLIVASSGDDDTNDTKFFRLFLPHQRATLAFLKSLVEHHESPDAADFRVLKKATSSTQTLEKTMKTLVADSLLLGVRRLLDGFTKWPCWSAVSVHTEGVPIFSSQPSDYITKIGEHFFGLVQELEAQLNFYDGRSGSGDDLLQWQQRLTSNSVEDILNLVMDMDVLSDSGARQLAADLDYLGNIISALGIDVPQSLIVSQKCLLLAPDEIAAMQVESRAVQAQVNHIAVLRQAAVRPRASS